LRRALKELQFTDELADGVVEGKDRGPVENLDVFESSESIFDYLTLGYDVKEKIMEFFLNGLRV